MDPPVKLTPAIFYSERRDVPSPTMHYSCIILCSTRTAATESYPSIHLWNFKVSPRSSGSSYLGGVGGRSILNIQYILEYFTFTYRVVLLLLSSTCSYVDVCVTIQLPCPETCSEWDTDGKGCLWKIPQQHFRCCYLWPLQFFCCSFGSG